MSSDKRPAVAVDILFADVMFKLLDQTTDQQQASRTVAEEVLHLSSARCVVLLRIRPDGSTNTIELPQDQRGMIEQPGIATFLDQARDISAPVFLRTADASPVVARIFQAAQLNNCLVVPITANGARHGTLLAFDCDHPNPATALLGNVEKLACLLALILGAATLQTETSRRLEEQQLRMAMLAVQNTVESIYWLDLDGNILYVNPAAEKEIGYSAAEIQKMTVADIDPNAPPKVWGNNGELALRRRAGQMRNFKTQHRHRDGHLIPIELNSAPFDYDGKSYSKSARAMPSISATHAAKCWGAPPCQTTLASGLMPREENNGLTNWTGKARSSDLKHHCDAKMAPSLPC